MIKNKRASTDTGPQSNSPAVAIFQWLTYAFWGWTAALTAALVTIVANFVLDGYSSDVASSILIIVAVVVLLPLALIFDHVFSRHERDHKTGIGMLLMVLHAVIFALVAVGGLATALFSGVSAILFSDDINGNLTALATAATVMVLFGLIFLRIMRPVTKSGLRTVVRSVLLLIVGAALVGAIVGPAAQAVVRQQDERTLRALQNVDFVIGNYVIKQKSLPDTFQDAARETSDDTSREAIERSLTDGRLTYTANIREPLKAEFETTLYYEVCATFDFADKDRGQFSFGLKADNDGFTQGITDISRDAGQTCYSLKYVMMKDNVVRPL